MGPAPDLTLTLSAEAVKRGGKLNARLEVAEDARDLPVEVELVCKARYDTYGFATTASGERTRSTQDAVAWRENQVVPAGSAGQSLSFQVPGNAPYSYQGRALGFAWELTACQRVPRRRDRNAEIPVQVTP